MVLIRHALIPFPLDTRIITHHKNLNNLKPKFQAVTAWNFSITSELFQPIISRLHTNATKGTKLIIAKSYIVKRCSDAFIPFSVKDNAPRSPKKHWVVEEEHGSDSRQILSLFNGAVPSTDAIKV